MISIFNADFFDADIEFGETSGVSVERPKGTRIFSALTATAAFAASTVLSMNASATELQVRPEVLKHVTSQAEPGVDADDFRSASEETLAVDPPEPGRTLEALKSLIVHMESRDLSSGDDDGAFVTPQASRNARQFIEKIASAHELPKVAPDGDGGLVFSWEKDGAPSAVVGFADDIIFAVQAPGTSSSRHLNEVTYRDIIPSDILRILPKRTA